MPLDEFLHLLSRPVSSSVTYLPLFCLPGFTTEVPPSRALPLGWLELVPHPHTQHPEAPFPASEVLRPQTSYLTCMKSSFSSQSIRDKNPLSFSPLLPRVQDFLTSLRAAQCKVPGFQGPDCLGPNLGSETSYCVALVKLLKVSGLFPICLIRGL